MVRDGRPTSVADFSSVAHVGVHDTDHMFQYALACKAEIDRPHYPSQDQDRRSVSSD